MELESTMYELENKNFYLIHYLELENKNETWQIKRTKN